MTLYEQRDYILEHFDFDRVRIAMIALNWTWGFFKERVPSIKELRQAAEHVLTQCINHKPEEPIMDISTGGFTALRYHDKLKLSFEVEDIDMHYL